MNQEIINAHQRIITNQAEKVMLLELENAQLKQALGNSQAQAKQRGEKVTELEAKVKELTPPPAIVLTEADAAADLAGTPRPDNPTVPAEATPAGAEAK